MCFRGWYDRIAADLAAWPFAPHYLKWYFHGKLQQATELWSTGVGQVTPV